MPPAPIQARSEPAFSVVIPAYNAARFIPETLDAILGQSHPPRRVIVVDDGSEDETREIVTRRFPDVDCLTIPNQGTPVARRIGIEHSDTDWIALCDGDDVWTRDHLERKRDLLQRFPDAELLFSNFHSFGDSVKGCPQHFSSAPEGWFERFQGETHGDWFLLDTPYRAILAFNPAYMSGLAFSRSAYDRMGGFLDKYARIQCEDAEFLRRFSALPNLVAAGDRQATWGYRRHGANKSRTRWRRFYCKVAILREHLDLGVVPPCYRDDVLREIRARLARAFDIACWDRSREGVDALWNELPSNQKTFRRHLRRWLVRQRLIPPSLLP
jgi:glycosyltransferase involved in cell wall biosynthesis